MVKTDVISATHEVYFLGGNRQLNKMLSSAVHTIRESRKAPRPENKELWGGEKNVLDRTVCVKVWEWKCWQVLETERSSLFLEWYWESRRDSARERRGQITTGLTVQDEALDFWVLTAVRSPGRVLIADETWIERVLYGFYNRLFHGKWTGFRSC